MSASLKRTCSATLILIAALAVVSCPAAGATGGAATKAARPARPRAVKPAESGTPAPPASTARPPAAGSDSTQTLRGGQEGTVFKSLTIEGEDRIHLDFDRPTLHLELDPSKAPGLEPGSARDVLDRSIPEYGPPLLAVSASQPCPYVGRPYLSGFSSGAVARFRPDVKSVERWKLLVADSRGQTVTTFQGKGAPPAEIAWDGRTSSGALVVPGLTYSYVFEAWDRAGNKRHFVGEGFSISAYRLDTPSGPVMVFSGRGISTGYDPGRGGGPQSPDPLVLEAASWLNQSTLPRQPIRVTASARTFEMANAMASGLTRQLAALTLGDPARIQGVAEVVAEGPEGGTFRIAPAK